MAGQDTPVDPAKALEFKEKGNKCFQAGDFVAAESLYSKAIDCDPTNPLLYTNRGLALLKLHRFPLAITLSQHAISLSPPPSISMKAHFQLAQAQIALHNPSSALESSKLAHKLCIDEIVAGGKGGGSIGPITELVLRCKKELWEQREDERLRKRGGLLEECARGLERERDAYVSVLQAEEGKEEDVERVKERYGQKIEELRRTFELAGAVGEEGKRRKVPDWCLDDITFSVMLDPVVTRTGQSYDRSSIMEHLKRSPTDPLTREPLRVEDLRPNLALKAACEEFLEENGWAVDW
ncbi:U-box-domain-containing protein [Hyaloscypha hepaticicola]|uniref:U-box-domain-containing protein n=1 Tax=Hyaloscypha hepaticicola TaxID=2082293 RepID=A0A2J6Q1S8_9HELO|nr:U-box-domain-containing protein [Hyaloscypha hepaticicola]